MEEDTVPRTCWDNMRKEVRQKPKIPSEYSAARTFNDLELALAHRISLSASGIVHRLKLPKRGAYVLKTMKSLKPGGYQRYHQQHNAAFSHAILYVVDKLKEHLNDYHKEITEDFFRDSLDDLAVAAGEILCRYLRNDEDENKMFFKTLYQLILKHTHYGSPNLINLVRAVDKEWSPPELAKFSYETELDSPLGDLQVDDYLENYKRFCG
jgi:hypothetical protein